jgi:hypothetical protein
VLGGGALGGCFRLLCLLAVAAFLDGLLAGTLCHRLRVPPSHSPPQLLDEERAAGTARTGGSPFV